MKKGRGGGKERKAPTHLIEISELSHAARVTKSRHNRKVCSQEKKMASHHDEAYRSQFFCQRRIRVLPRATTQGS